MKKHSESKHLQNTLNFVDALSILVPYETLVKNNLSSLLADM